LTRGAVLYGLRKKVVLYTVCRPGKLHKPLRARPPFALDFHTPMGLPDPPGFFDVRMKGFRNRAEVADALALLDRRVKALPREPIAAAAAAGRVLAAEVIAPAAVPAFDRAAMDGYALRAQETFGAGIYQPLELNVVGSSLPAHPFVGQVAPGQAVRIMTGAPMPEGADAVLPAEAAQETAGKIRVTEPVSPQRHVGRRGEDVAAGQAVLPVGRQLRPQDVGLLASIGISLVQVIRRPRVRILATGDELVPAGTVPKAYQIVDSNSVMLSALARRDGAEIAAMELLPDERQRIRSAMTAAPGDVLLMCGGSSVGQEDHAPALVAELGELPIHGLALRPASPSGIGFLGEQVVFLLPGNPVSCLCAYDLFAGRSIRLLGGRPSAMPYRTRRLPLGAKIVSAVGRVDYVRVKVIGDRIEPLAVSGAGLLSTTTAADGFVLVERDREGHAAGEEVTVFLYDG
jgi:molybdopterin molybdotransferase